MFAVIVTICTYVSLNRTVCENLKCVTYFVQHQCIIPYELTIIYSRPYTVYI